LWALLTGLAILASLRFGVVKGPGADSQLLDHALALSLAGSVMAAVVLRARRQAGTSGSQSRLAGLTASLTAATSILALAAALQPLPAACHDALTVVMLTAAAISTMALLGRSSRASGIIGLVLVGQAYATVLPAGRPHFILANRSPLEVVRSARTGGPLQSQYSLLGMLEMSGTRYVVTNDGTFPVGSVIPGAGTVLRIDSDAVHLRETGGAVIVSPYAHPREPLSTPASSGPVRIGGQPAQPTGQGVIEQKREILDSQSRLLGLPPGPRGAR
jgi:hypothetical protein